MEDRFKFRHWDKRINKMFYPERNDNFGYYVHNPDIIETMQCTGLTDKNEKLIYEGDILKIDETSRLVVVRFKGISFELFAEPTNLVGYHNDKYIPEDCEIVGNIYENPELLED